MSHGFNCHCGNVPSKGNWPSALEIWLNIFFWKCVKKMLYLVNWAHFQLWSYHFIGTRILKNLGNFDRIGPSSKTLEGTQCIVGQYCFVVVVVVVVCVCVCFVLFCFVFFVCVCLFLCFVFLITIFSWGLLILSMYKFSWLRLGSGGSCLYVFPSPPDQVQGNEIK